MKEGHGGALHLSTLTRNGRIYPLLLPLRESFIVKSHLFSTLAFFPSAPSRPSRSLPFHLRNPLPPAVLRVPRRARCVVLG